MILPISASDNLSDVALGADCPTNYQVDALNEAENSLNDNVLGEDDVSSVDGDGSGEESLVVGTALKSDNQINIVRGTSYTVQLLDENNAPIVNKTVQIGVNGAVYNRTTDGDGFASLPIGLRNGNYVVTCNFAHDGFTSSNFVSNILVIPTSVSKLTASDVTIYREFGGKFKVKLAVGDMPLASKKVHVTVNGVTYTLTTNKNGEAFLSIGLRANTYTATFSYDGEQNINLASGSAKIIVKNAIKTKFAVVDAPKYVQGIKKAFSVKLTDSSGKALKGKTVTFKVNGVSYKSTTDSNGKASIQIGLKKGTYTVSYSFASSNPYLKSSGSYKISVQPAISGKGAIWVNGYSMKSVNFNTLANNGIQHIFLNSYAFTLYGKSSVLSWIKQANNRGLKVHIWMQVFYDGGWIVPVNKDGSYKYSLMNSRINTAKYYAGLSGVAGIHLDYLRFGGTAYKYKNSVAAINYFTQKCCAEVHKVKSSAIVSAAIMPEPSSNKYYYGQDAATLSKYLDVLVPMVYKGNYHASTNWIKTTTAAFVKMSSKAQVWTGLQCYVSDDDLRVWSYSNLYKDAQAAKNGGATGVVLFRYGLTSFINCGTLFKS